MEPRIEELERRFEEERQWWRDRLDWFIQWYNEQQVEFEERLLKQQNKTIGLKALKEEMFK